MMRYAQWKSSYAKDTEQLILEKEQFESFLHRQQTLTTFLQQWKTSTPITEDDIIELHDKLKLMIPLSESLERLSEIQSQVTSWIEEVNVIRELEPPSIEEIIRMTPVIKEIFLQCHMDVSIEMMDTSKDMDMLQRIQEQEDENYALEIARQLEQDQVEQDRVEQDLPTQLPICSLRQRIGLTVLKLRELAIQHNIPAYGSKTELAIRLMNRGLVQIV